VPASDERARLNGVHGVQVPARDAGCQSPLMLLCVLCNLVQTAVRHFRASFGKTDLMGVGTPFTVTNPWIVVSTVLSLWRH
jgi:hypothetical protein